jgi:signal transduction histidine kinase
MKDLGVVMHDLPKEAKLQLQKDALSETIHGMTIMNANQDEFAVRQLKQALTSAQDKLVTKQSFVRYVSHEIRTPLMVVDIGLVLLEKDLAAVSTNIKNLKTIGNCDGAKSHVSKISHVLPSSTVSDDEEEKIDNGMGTLMNSLDIVKECKCSMGVAIGILNDLLAYEKIESGVFQLNKKTVPATRFIKETIDEFKLQVSSVCEIA